VRTSIGGGTVKKIIRSAWEEDDWSMEEQQIGSETIYDKETRSRMVEEGVIEAWEAAFLDGALDDMDWDEAS